MNDFLNKEVAQPLLETPSPSITAADATKKRAIDRWENEGGEIPLPIKPLSTRARDEE